MNVSQAAHKMAQDYVGDAGKASARAELRNIYAEAYIKGAEGAKYENPYPVKQRKKCTTFWDGFRDGQKGRIV